MKKIALTVLALALSVLTVSAQWAPAGDRIRTTWAEQINPSNVLPEYPRPLMERTDWMNLNGLWDYAVTAVDAAKPAQADGQILVPFAIESSLSGVGRMLSDQENLWYKRSFTVPSSWKGKHVLLHFGAVDWKADVWVDDVYVGGHTGGYTPFSFDITEALIAKGAHTLTVKVWDGTAR